MPVPGSLNKAGRAAETALKIVSSCINDRRSKRWRRALTNFLNSDHDTVTSLRDALEPKQHEAAVADLIRLLGWMVGTHEEPPAHAINRWTAIHNKVSSVRSKTANEQKWQWIEVMLKDNARLGHRWAAEPTKSDRRGESAADAVKHLDQQVRKFEQLWLADGPNECPKRAFAELFTKLRNVALQSGLHQTWLEDHAIKFQPESIGTKIRRFKKRTSTGTDWLELSKLRDAPDEVLESLGATLQQMAIHLVGPAHSFQVLLDLIPKKNDGFRTTATFASHWRILTAILFECFQCYDANAGFDFDSARAGQHPGRLIMQRSLEASAHRSAHLHHTLCLWDISGFFEHCNCESIGQAVTQEGLPLVASVISIFGHASARSIRWQGHLSAPIVPNRSLATGCHTSPSYARAILKRPITKAAQAEENWRTSRRSQGYADEDSPIVKMMVHVDDFSQEASGSASGILQALTIAGESFIAGAQSSGFSISSKSVVVSTSPKVAKTLQKVFRRQGVEIQVATSAEHLGHNRTNGRIGALHGGLKKRFQRARTRNQRIALLSRHTPKAKRLFTTGTMPVACYSSPAVGLNLQLQCELDSLAYQACSKHVLNPCSMTVLWNELGQIPSVERLVDFVRDFMVVWKSLTMPIQQGLESAWEQEKRRQELHPERSGWSTVSDTVGAMVAVLRQAHWMPHSPTKWSTDKGKKATFSDDPVATATV